MLTSCCDYSLVMRAVPLANLLSISEKLRQRALKVFLALIEIKTTENFLKTRGRPIPCLLEELERLTGLSKRSLSESLKDLERYQLLSVTETVEFNPQLLGGSQTILTTVSKNRNCNRIIPIPRQLLRRLSKSGTKTTILSALTLLIRGASYPSSVRLRKLLKFLIFATLIQKAIAKLFTNINSSNPLNRQNCSKCELSHLELLAV